MTMQHDCSDVLILGAGISGLFCAIETGKRGKNVTLIDHAPKPLRKLLISGGGKCNVTNTTITEAQYYGENPKFVRSALAGLTSSHLQTLLHQANILLEEREEGQLFCKRSSVDMWDYLLQELHKTNSQLCLNQCIHEVTHEQKNGHGLFTVKTATGFFSAPSLVIATGSPAWPQVGATDLGMRLARQFGHRVVPVRPALTGFCLPQHSALFGLAGIALRVTLTHVPVQTSGSKIKPHVVAQNLPLLFTHSGISGPAALQASLYWNPNDTLLCCFLPEDPAAGANSERAAFIAAMQGQEGGKQLLKTMLKPLFPQRLAEALLPEELRNKKVAEIGKKDRAFILQQLLAFPLAPLKTEGYKKAEVCAGGVSTEAVSSKTMESAHLPGLYFCGEVLDITGRLGGYNIHWALASGLAAGRGVAG